MIVSNLKLANIRAIELAEFQFQPGFNLIVGVNGVGKSTVLDTIRTCMSRILPSITDSRAKTMSFSTSDIRSGFAFLDVELSLTIGVDDFRFTRRQWRDTIAADDVKNVEKLRREILDSERLRERPRNLLRQLDESHGVSDSDAFVPSKAELKSAVHAGTVAPNCIFFSTNRSFASTAKSRAEGGKSAAYAGALLPRPMYLANFVDWMRVQKTLATEHSATSRHLQVVRSAVDRFLPAYGNLRPTDEKTSRLLIDRDGIALDVAQLSDGERGMLALALDLARRLSQANPSLDDPLNDGHAIVLIDEIELHLHPGWQRQIISKLAEVFPKCQFIATTHSPQVIGELEHDRIHIIADGEVYSPSHSFGVDSSRVLEEIMDTDPRTKEVSNLLSRTSRKIGDERYEDARALLGKLSSRLGENDPDVTRIQTLLDFMADDT